MAKTNSITSDEFIKEVARYYADNNSTVRKTAKVFGISKTLVHIYITEYLERLDKELYQRCMEIINRNLNERHIRGGKSTQKMWQEKWKDICVVNWEENQDLSKEELIEDEELNNEDLDFMYDLYFASRGCGYAKKK